MNKFVLGLAAILMSGLPAAAQTEDQPKDQQPEDCQAQPDANGARKPQADAQPNAQSGDLTASLEPCGGVLKPPPTGDRNATVPPADGSQMPVIKPGQVPPQTSK